MQICIFEGGIKIPEKWGKRGNRDLRNKKMIINLNLKLFFVYEF